MSNGPLNRPKLPGIPGIDSFKGHSFHTSRWDYAYTGGDSYGSLTKLADKRVAIIGTGATAIQCVPHLGRWAKQLYVFQRTPSSVDLRGNKPTDPDWAAALEPGWQKRRMENFNILVSGGMQDEDLVSDGWTDIIRNLISIAAVRGDKPMTMEEAQGGDGDRRLPEDEPGPRPGGFRRSRTRRAAEALKPWYRQFCKRPTFNDDYLPTFNRPNVTLVDTGGPGRRADRRDRPLDGRRPLRGGLHHLRDRLRGRHQLHAARRLRDRRARRADAVATTGRTGFAPCTAP